MKSVILMAAMVLGSVAMADCPQPEGVICLHAQGSIYIRYSQDDNTVFWGTETLTKKSSTGDFTDAKGDKVSLSFPYVHPAMGPVVIVNGEILGPCAEVFPTQDGLQCWQSQLHFKPAPKMSSLDN